MQVGQHGVIFREKRRHGVISERSTWRKWIFAKRVWVRKAVRGGGQRKRIRYGSHGQLRTGRCGRRSRPRSSAKTSKSRRNFSRRWKKFEKEGSREWNCHFFPHLYTMRTSLIEFSDADLYQPKAWHWYQGKLLLFYSTWLILSLKFNVTVEFRK